MNTSTVYPRHDSTAYAVEEHDIVSAPPELWPMIQAWSYERRAQAFQQIRCLRLVREAA